MLVKNPIFGLAVGQPKPQLPPPDRKFTVTNYDSDRGSVGYYRVGIPFYYLYKWGLCETLLIEDIQDGVKDVLEERLKADLDALAKSDILIVNRPYTVAQIRFLLAARAKGKVTFVDSDDNLEAIDDLGNNAMTAFWTKERRDYYVQGLFQADVISVASKWLAELYRERWPEKMVKYIPNPVDTTSSRWNVPHSKYPEHPFTIGIFAGHTHNRDMEMLEQPIRTLLELRPDWIFKVVGFCPPWVYTLPPDRVEIKEGKALHEYPALISDIDVGCAPLIPHNFNKAKTDTKGFEATMAGVAVVVSPVGEYVTRWKDGKTCLFAETEDDWIDRLLYLIDNPQKAKELNRAAVRYILGFRSADVIVPLWYDALRSSLSSRRPAEIPYGSFSAVAPKPGG